MLALRKVCGIVSACVPVCCVVCTAWFFTVAVRALARFVLGSREYDVWRACLREWIHGIEYFFFVMVAACSCVYIFVTQLGYYALADILPVAYTDVIGKLARPTCLSAWA